MLRLVIRRSPDRQIDRSGLVRGEKLEDHVADGTGSHHIGSTDMRRNGNVFDNVFKDST
jgi:hypothetical protein